MRDFNTSSPDKSDARMMAFADALPSYTAYVVTLNGVLCYRMVNRRYIEAFGLPVEQVVGHPVKEVLGQSYEPIREHLEAAMAGVAQRFETRMRTTAGERILAVQHLPDRDEYGRVLGVIVHGHDVTERRQAEDQLRVSEERFRLALTAANGVGTWDWDVPNNLVWADATCAFYYDVDPDSAAVGTPIEEFVAAIHPEDIDRAEEHFRRAIHTGEEFYEEYRVCRADGVERWIAARGRCLRAADGRPSHFPGVILDVTERKRSEEALVRTEKLAAVGRLAANIAHEINNPLESVVNLLYLIEHTVTEDVMQAKRYARLAQHELGRVSQIATQTLRFFKQETWSELVSLDELFEPVMTLYQGRMVNAGITLDRRLPSDLQLRCFAGEVRQILNNLIGNAIDAMRDGGRLVLRARKTGKGVRISVGDTGCGMNADTVKRVFEPFFTTKGDSGTGLGLWVSAEIVQKHKGRLSVRSSTAEQRHGTVFSLWLPQVRALQLVEKSPY